MIESIIVDGLARRAVNTVDAHQKNEASLPAWPVILVFAVVAVFIAINVAFTVLFTIIRYTYGEVIASLAMVESPSSTLYIPVANEPNATPEDKSKVDAEGLLVKEAPITSSLKKAERHLVAKGGRWIRFRGLSIAIFQSFITLSISNFFVRLFPRVPGVSSVSFVVASVLTAQISTGWTHVVISEVGSKFSIRQVLSFAVWKKVAVPTLVSSIAEQVAVFIPFHLAAAWGLFEKQSMQDYDGKKLLLVAALGLASLLITLLMVIPARVTLTRVQASLLPEDIETIVPFDRSFGGKVVPAIVGGTGVVGMLDAWKTFGVDSRVRLVKIYIKTWALKTLCILVWATFVGGSMSLYMPKNF